VGNQKRPGEKEPGTFHYNPGNMSGKTEEKSPDKSSTKQDKNQGKTVEGRDVEP
jgi:hypothetical protein